MNDDAFHAFVVNSAPRYEIETLERIMRSLSDNIASRRWGKPAGIEIGSKVEATMFGGHWVQCGEVVGLSPKACTIQEPDSERTSRINYMKYAVRLMDVYEWNRLCLSLAEHRKETAERQSLRESERNEDRERAIRERDVNAMKPRTLQALNGSVNLFRGAFVHAFRPDQGDHEYGVVISLSPKKIVLSGPESDWEPWIWVAKNEIHILNEREWAVVDAELRRRRREYEEATTQGRKSEVRDYSTTAIAY